jgi:hypothetical protein
MQFKDSLPDTRANCKILDKVLRGTQQGLSAGCCVRSVTRVTQYHAE